MRRTGSLLMLALLPLALTIPLAAQTDEELEFGQYVDRVMLARGYVVIDPALESRVEEIGQRLVPHTEKPDMQYTFRVMNDTTINAYATSGGFVFVNSGLLDIIESEDELAAILGHEIAHTAGSHKIEELYEAHAQREKGRWTGLALGAVIGLAAGAAGASAGMSTQGVGNLVDLGFDLGESVSISITNSIILGHSRELELEADSVGLELATRAGYDPYAFVNVLRRMESVRDRLNLTRDNYQSALINAEPGLEARIEEVQRRLQGG